MKLKTKFEIRVSNIETRVRKFEYSKLRDVRDYTRSVFLNFVLRICFGFRDSDFECLLS